MCEYKKSDEIYYTYIKNLLKLLPAASIKKKKTVGSCLFRFLHLSDQRILSLPAEQEGFECTIHYV